MEAWALRSYLNRILPPELKEKPVMVVQIGNERTIIYVHQDGMPIVARELSWGGRDLTLAICKKYGILLVVDEVICGFGRLGEWFGFQHFGMTPDLVPMAKGLS